MAIMGVGSAVIVAVDVSVGARVGRGVRVNTGVLVDVNAGTPIGAVASSTVGEIVGNPVGASDVMVAVAGNGEARPAFSIAHLPNPVRVITTVIKTTRTIPVNEKPPADVG
jgi:hypothetical protein